MRKNRIFTLFILFSFILILNISYISAQETNDSYIIGLSEDNNYDTIYEKKVEFEIMKDHLTEKINNTSGITLVDSWWINNALQVKIKNKTVLENINNTVYVKNVKTDRKLKLKEPVSNSKYNHYDETWNLKQVRATSVWDHYNVKGSNIRILVADTGVNASHPDIKLSDNKGWKDFVNQKQKPYDNIGHGTHVSSLITGKNNNSYYIGNSPESNLAHAKICSINENCSVSNLYDSIQWSAETDSDILSLSIGGPASSLYQRAIENAMKSGVLVIASSGNSGTNTITTPGSEYNTLSVGSSNFNKKVSEFSSGKIIDVKEYFGFQVEETWPKKYIKPDVVAPGNSIIGADNKGGYTIYSGTSMAAPHIAGISALIKSANPNLKPLKIKEIIENSSRKPETWNINNTKHIGKKDIRYGYGIPNAMKAMQKGIKNTGFKGKLITIRQKPINDVKIKLNNTKISTKTNKKGKFELNAPRNREYTIKINKEGYKEKNLTRSTFNFKKYSELTNIRLYKKPTIKNINIPKHIVKRNIQNIDTLNIKNIKINYNESILNIYLNKTKIKNNQTKKIKENTNLTIKKQQKSHTNNKTNINITFKPKENILNNTIIKYNKSVNLNPGNRTKIGIYDNKNKLKKKIEKKLKNYKIQKVKNNNYDKYDILIINKIKNKKHIPKTKPTIYLDSPGNASNGVTKYTKNKNIKIKENTTKSLSQVKYTMIRENKIFNKNLSEKFTIHKNEKIYYNHLNNINRNKYDIISHIGRNYNIIKYYLGEPSFIIDKTNKTILAPNIGSKPYKNPFYKNKRQNIIKRSIKYLQGKYMKIKINNYEIKNKNPKIIKLNYEIKNKIENKKINITLYGDIPKKVKKVKNKNNIKFKLNNLRERKNNIKLKIKYLNKEKTINRTVKHKINTHNNDKKPKTNLQIGIINTTNRTLEYFILNRGPSGGKAKIKEIINNNTKIKNTYIENKNYKKFNINIKKTSNITIKTKDDIEKYTFKNKTETRNKTETKIYPTKILTKRTKQIRYNIVKLYKKYLRSYKVKLFFSNFIEQIYHKIYKNKKQ